MMKKIEDSKNKVVLIFLYLQPFLDILAAFLMYNGISNYITSFIRIMFMFFMIVYLFFAKYDNKRKVILYLILLITYLLIHILLMIIYKDVSVLFYELRNTISTFYFVFLLITFGVIYSDKCISKIHLRNLWFIYLLFIFIPNILGIGFNSYSHSKTGMSGFFYSANVVGSILVILLPTIFNTLKKIPIWVKCILIIVTLYSLFSLGTKTPVLALLIIIIFNVLYFAYKLFKNKNKKGIIIIISSFILVALTGIIVIPKTSFYKNLEIHYEFLEKNNIKVGSKKFFDHFIFSQRLSMEERSRVNYNNSPLIEKLFGIGYIENYGTDDVNLKIVEMDYFDIFYREGIIGFVLFFIPVIIVITKFLKNYKNNFDNLNIFISILLIFLLALFQGHIFITPAISIFVALIFIISIRQIKC